MSHLAKLRISVAAVLLISLVSASAMRSFGLFVNDIYWLQEDLGGDKVVHGIMGAVLMTSGLLLFCPRSLWSIGSLGFAVMVLLSLEELSQMLATTRELDLLDLVAGCTGAGAMALIFAAALCLIRHLIRPSAPHNNTASSE